MAAEIAFYVFSSYVFEVQFVDDLNGVVDSNADC
jgi:hypothetical protein